MSRFGGFRSGWSKYISLWTSLRTTTASSAEKPTSAVDFDYTEAGGIWTLDSTVQFKKGGRVPAALYDFTTWTFTNGNVDTYNARPLSTFQSAYSSAPFSNDTQLFNVVNGIQFWKVPATGNYTINVAGAGGGTIYAAAYNAGRGVIVSGDVDLTKDDILRIIVGTRGGRWQYTAGGGGASSVIGVDSMSKTDVSGDLPWIIAGGGGGAGNSGGNAKDASFTETPINGAQADSGSNGTGGYAGQTSNGGWGSGGAGWLGNGGGGSGAHSNYQGNTNALRQDGAAGAPNGCSPTHGTGWTSYGNGTYHNYSVSGSCYGAPGGFGGGGSGACNGGGGGAGWSGGGRGGGGGSTYFNTSVMSNRSNNGYVASNTDGYVTITLNA